MKLLNDITPLEKDFTRWYKDVVLKGNLIKYGDTQGSMIFKPISYGIWENIRTVLDKEFKKIGVQNVYLPLLIRKELITKEKEHVKGFAPELATVTKVGDRKLQDELVIRPTSETLFGKLFASDINSYNDLPILYNQWANVLRWEKKTNPFLRNREFLWQEGHTAHSGPIEARKLSRKMIKLYAKFAKKYLAMPVIIGKKTANEKFAGAVSTYTIESMMKDGKALQSGTSHYLGKNFAKAFDVQFKNKENKKEYVFQTSWGVSTRLIGGIIMIHGDNRGSIIPPMIAPNQIDIIEIFGNKNSDVRNEAQNLFKLLSKKHRVRLDNTNKGPGFKAAKSEIEGTPIRIEVGPRDLENGQVIIVRRDTNEKKIVNINNIKKEVNEIMKSIQTNLYDMAEKRLLENTVKAKTFEDLINFSKDNKFVIVPFAGGAKEEKIIKDKTGASARCIPFNHDNKEAECIITKKKTKRYVLFAKAY